MIKTRTVRTMSDVTTSLVGSSFRRVYRDGRVSDERRIMTLGQLLAKPSPKPTTKSSTIPRT